MYGYEARKFFYRDGNKRAIIQGEYKDLHPGNKVLVARDGRYYKTGIVETVGIAGLAVVRFEKEANG